MSLFKTYGLSLVLSVIGFGVSLLIYKWIESYFSNNQTKEKEIKQKLIIQDKNTLFNRLSISIFSASLALVILAPLPYIFEIVFRLLFRLPLKGTTTELIAMLLYISISIIFYFVSLIFIFKWLKKNLNIVWSKMVIKKSDKTH